MLAVVRSRLSPRRKRLFAIACCKSLFGEERTWEGYPQLLQLAELMAESGIEESTSELLSRAAPFLTVAYAHGVITLLNEDSDRAVDAWANMIGLSKNEQQQMAEILREIVGDPFVETHLDPALLRWHDGAIPIIARSCYDSGDFSQIGILGDALEEAGCSDRAIVEHVRNSQNHYRGCWVVDLILGKK
jgi:hypothetical protein